MNTNFLIKYYGLLISFFYPFIGYLLSYTLWAGITYNRNSFEINFLGLLTLMFSMIWITKKYYAVRPIQVLLLFTASAFLGLNLITSMLGNWINNSDMHNNEKGMSFVIVLPFSFLFNLLWGFVFDRIKHEKIQ